MPRKRPVTAEITPQGRVTRRSTASSGPSAKRKPLPPEPESESDSEEEPEPQPSTSKKTAKKQPPPKGKAGTKGKKAAPVKEDTSDEEEEEEEEDDSEEEHEDQEEGSSREASPEPPPPPKKPAKGTTVTPSKKKKKGSPPPSRSPSPPPEPPKGKKGAKVTPVKAQNKNQKKKKPEPEPPKPATRGAPKRKKQVHEEESPEEKKLRRRAARKARRLKEAKTRDKLTLLEKLEMLKAKKVGRERRKHTDKEDIIRQKYGQRKMKPIESKWNFGPISSINQRRRDEMMQYFPTARFAADGEKPTVMNNFKRATVKYEMDVLNPFITCGVCNGYIVDATTIIDCMHTFCKSCLLGFFGKGNKTCPTCATFIHGSHPTHYVTYDRAVNELVNQFVPNLEKTELEMRKQFLRECQESLGIDTAKEDRERRLRLEQERITGTNRCYALEAPRFSHHRDDCQVPVKLLPGTPNLPLICRPFIVTSEMTTMNTLKKYLSLQIWDDQSRYADLDMFCDGQLMGKDFSIRFVWMMKRRGQPKSEPLIIRYHMIKNFNS